MAHRMIMQESISDSSSDESAIAPKRPLPPLRAIAPIASPVRSPAAARKAIEQVISLDDSSDEDTFPSPQSSSIQQTSHRPRLAPYISAFAPSSPSASQSSMESSSLTPIDAPEPVPLRKRAYSDLGPTNAAPLPRGSSETPERWRNRLWPAKAIIMYCRVITRCQPPCVSVDEKVRLGRGKCELTPHWKENTLSPIKTVFENINQHSTSFFLLTVEESREAVLKGEEDEEAAIQAAAAPAPAALPSQPAPAQQANGWVECEVINIVAESEFASSYDIRLGSVWVVKVAVRAPVTFAGGDLMILHAERPLLAIVQPWDPDYDIKYGINFQGTDELTVNLLICIDGGEGASSSSNGLGCGGWATPGTIHPGVVFKMALLGNVMTYIRECQALMSMKLLHPSLRDALLCPHAARVPKHPRIVQYPEPLHIPALLWNKLKQEYNTSQMKALKMVCQRNEDGSPHPVCLLQGPPGTGKTKTILAILALFLSGSLKPSSKATKVIAGSSFRSEDVKRIRSDSLSGADRPRILICAPSNTAVDELVYRILTQGVLGSDGQRTDINIVRIGHALKEDYLKRKNDNISAESYNHLVRVVERVSLDNIVEDRARMLQTAEKKAYGVHFKPAEIRKQVLERADIIACTLSGAGSQPILEVILRITGFKFDAVIIDEAAQAVEPSSLIPFKYNPSIVVMVGDPCQLPATVFSRLCKDANYHQSLFLRLQRSGTPLVMLETQYRMHPEIACFPSKRYYNNQLLTDASVLTSPAHQKAFYEDASGLFKPIVFHDLAYSLEQSEGNSICNALEARYVVALFMELHARYPAECVNVGIIAPYRAQRRLIVSMLRSTYGRQVYNQLDCEISTVDGFQGREKDIIIFSCVRAPSRGNRRGNDGAPGGSSIGGIGFLKEWQRLNVAITRARFALWIVGHQATLQRDPEWSALLEYVHGQRALVTMNKEKALQDLLNGGQRTVGPMIQQQGAGRGSSSSGHKHHHQQSSSSSAPLSKEAKAQRKAYYKAKRQEENARRERREQAKSSSAQEPQQREQEHEDGMEVMEVVKVQRIEDDDSEC